MQQTDHAYSSVSGNEAGGQLRPRRRRLIISLVVILLLVVLALVPPLISISRFQRRIVAGISLSLGRPVHMDHVALNLLPLPSLTIDNLVVEEDPHFGSEPLIRSSSVTARLRVSSLWRRRLEFSRISFVDPSINLVHNPDGRWNVEAVLLQAARIEAAPTGQQRAGAAPRFPYIEASGARLNLKLGAEKMPFSLTDADFALWLPEPKQWRLRLKARPVRTDSSVSDTGSVQIEATLGRPVNLTEAPLSVQGAWRNVPMGEASRIVLGRDAGLRGDMTLTTRIEGTVGHSALRANLHIEGLRRSDFVPEHALPVDIECQARAAQSFHVIEAAQCGWPLAGAQSTLAITGSVPDVRHLDTASVQIGTSGIAAPTLLQWSRVVSARMPPSLTATGLLTGSVVRESGDQGSPRWSGHAVLRKASLSSPRLGEAPMPVSDVTFLLVSPSDGSGLGESRPGSVGVRMQPTEIELGGKEPAALDGSLDATGYRLHLTGTVLPARVLALGAAVPQFGEGLAEALPPSRGGAPVRLDLTAHRVWGQAQVWSDTGSTSAGAARSTSTPPAPSRTGGRSPRPR